MYSNCFAFQRASNVLGILGGSIEIGISDDYCSPLDSKENRSVNTSATIPRGAPHIWDACLLGKSSCNLASDALTGTSNDHRAPLQRRGYVDYGRHEQSARNDKQQQVNAKT